MSYQGAPGGPARHPDGEAMSLSGHRIIVIGAGIGGLACALALRRRGAEVTVLEQAGEIAEVGAGLQISPNGVAVLRALGLEEALAARAVRARAVVLKDYRRAGEVLRLDLTRLAPTQHYYLVHRGDLIDLLARAAREAGVRVRLLQKVAGVSPGSQPGVGLENGRLIEADLVIGADGLHSRARVALNGESAPFFTGQVAWRALIANRGGLGAEARVHMAPRRHLVSYPLRGGEMVNLVAVQERAGWVDEGWHHRDDPANLRAAFADFGPEAQALLAEVDEVHLWGLFRHPVARNWQAGGVALIGDAAHPTLPFMAQGANMALEDAWVLADCLDAAGEVAERLARYQARRRDRVERVVAAASGNAWKYHLGFAPLRGAAHLALKIGGAVAPARMLAQYDWIYGFDVTA